MIYHLTTNLRQKERENRIKSLDQCKEWPGVGPIDCECCSILESVHCKCILNNYETINFKLN